MSEDKDDARKGHREEGHQDTEAVLMAVWRRVIEEGCGPEMSLTEAAAVLGASVASVRKRVADGVIPAYRDPRGRIRIVPRIGPPTAPVIQPTNPESQVPASMVGRLMDELRNTREQLNQAVRDSNGLQREKAAAEQALEHTKEELGAMWRLLSARTSNETKVSAPVAEAKRLSQLSPTGVNVTKIQSQITAVRKLAKRRKWPWALVS